MWQHLGKASGDVSMMKPSSVMDRRAPSDIAVAPLAWVPWVPGNPSIFEQWVPEPINFGDKGPKFTPFSVQNEQEILG